MNFSPSWILLLILLAGFSLGLVWFSNTSYAAVLRSIGVPVPYCSFMRPTNSAELSFSHAGAGYFYGSEDVLAFMAFRPSEELVTSLCSASEKGANVRVILSPMLSKDAKLLSVFDKCKIKYRVSDSRLPNIAVSDNCVLTYGYDRDVIVCEDEYASQVKKYLEGLWRG